MTPFFEYLGLFLFVVGALLGSLLLLPEIGAKVGSSLGELGRIGLAFLVIAAGFTWFYFPAIRQAEDQ